MVLEKITISIAEMEIVFFYLFTARKFTFIGK